MENDTGWLLAENLKKQEEQERQAIDHGTAEGTGDFGAYYAYRKGLREDLIRQHVMIDDPAADVYANILKNFLSYHGYPLQGRILDVGCAIGTITDGLRRANPGGQTLGLDISQDAIAVAREKYPACIFYDRSADEAAEISDASLDIIHAREFYPFTRTDDEDFHLKYLKVFFTKLKPGGILILYMAARRKGLHQTFAALRPRIAQLGFGTMIKKPAILQRLGEILGPKLQRRWIYQAILPLQALVSILMKKPRNTFYILEKNGV